MFQQATVVLGEHIEEGFKGGIFGVIDRLVCLGVWEEMGICCIARRFF